MLILRFGLHWLVSEHFDRCGADPTLKRHLVKTLLEVDNHWLTRESQDRRRQKQTALLKVQAHLPNLNRWSDTVFGWYSRFNQLHSNRGLTPIPTRLPADPCPRWHRNGCNNVNSRLRCSDTTGLCRQVLGSICNQLCEQFDRLFKDHVRGIDLPRITVHLEKKMTPDIIPFDLSFTGNCDYKKTTITLEFDAKLKDRIGLISKRDRAGLYYIIAHEFQHILDHASDRSSFCKDIVSDHVFAEGFMDEVSDIIIRRLIRKSSILRHGDVKLIDAICKIREQRMNGTDLDANRKDETRLIIEGRQLGIETLRALRNEEVWLPLLPKSSAADWDNIVYRFIVGLYAAPGRPKGPNRLRKDRFWRARVIRSLGPLVNYYRQGVAPNTKPDPMVKKLLGKLRELAERPLDYGDPSNLPEKWFDDLIEIGNRPRRRPY